MSNVFTKIIRRELPAYIVAEDAQHIAFLDIHPVVLGHTLVVPKTQVDDVFDLEVGLMGALARFAQKVALGLRSSMSCRRVGLAVMGFEIPHAHLHLLPLQREEDFNLHGSKLQLKEATFSAISGQIKAAICI